MQINIDHVSVILNNHKLVDDICLYIDHNQQWAIIGESGSGKTTLGKAISNQVFHHGTISLNSNTDKQFKVVFVDQQHQFKNKQNIQQFYHQQRFNSFDTEETLTVAEILYDNSFDLAPDWIDFFGLNHLLNKPMIQLSNGENKRLQLVKALSENPSLIILDNPFIGLDKDGRNLLQLALNQLVQKGLNILLICSHKDIPDCITHVAVLDKGKLVANGPKENILKSCGDIITQYSVNSIHLLHEHYKLSNTDFETAVELKNVSICYKQQNILADINLTIRKGEKWCVSGPNGSGKSTLLSLITADNPQAFANQIWLFDKRKGSGESIWDIKKKIGHVSPELHLFFEKGIEVKAAVASGLFDTIGLFKKITKEDEALIEKWMTITGIVEHKNKMLFQLSLGEQRLVMLTRALVKSPPLLILDEPCQGLDENQTIKIKSILEAISSIKDLTLVYVSHYNDDIPSTINRFLYLENGKIKHIA